ncbi:hypothetical protein [Massilia niastensis]|uniref:hypothetical protein n=1 Tax=Massilia niastensis TaxID=544911 RepID=UPI00035F7D66|nr:hypothetical protein [Massilia niastensis]
MGTSTEAVAASQVRHRIKLPNSRRRLIKLVGVGAGGARVAGATGERELQEVSVAMADPGNAAAMVALLESFAEADMVVVVACAGDDLGAVQMIRQAARVAGVLVTGIFLQQDHGPAAQGDLAILRPSCDLLVIASDPDYVVDMLVELGA